jgi:tRNA pseudouridine38-40 synthase
MSSTRNIKLVLEYDGTHFHGWQFQINGISIQQILEGVIGKVVAHPVKLIAAGRTDTGVHAKGQVVNFHTESKIPLNNLIRGINSMVATDIVILSAEDMPEKFNARRDATLRWYRYRILNRHLPSVFESRYSYHYRVHLDIEKMKLAGNYLLGKHDFSAFNASLELTQNPVRTIKEFSIESEEDILNIDIKANGFFHHMVRTIVGTLIEIGRGKMKYQNMERIIQSKNRKLAGPNVPPHGLFLMGVEFKH